MTHLLVVDDEVSILELIKNSLGKDGYLITACQNADDVDIKDKAGRPIENIKVSIGEGKETVNPSTDGTTEAESEVEIILESDNAFDTLSRIDRICFKLKADSKESSGVPLKDTQWIQVKKSALQVPGGVNIDLN